MRRILGHYVATSWILFGVVEAAVLTAICGVGFFFTIVHSDFSAGRLTAFAILLSLGVVALIQCSGLYQGNAVINLRRSLWRAAWITLPMFALAVWTTGELAHHTSVPIYPYRWQWTFALIASWLGSIVLFRLALWQLYRSGLFTRKIAVLGPPGQAAEVANLAMESDQRFRVVANVVLRAEIEETRLQEEVARILRAGASEIVIAVNGEALPWKLLMQSRLSGTRVTDYLDFYEREARRIRIDSLREDWFALSRGFDNTVTVERLRRAKDVLFAVLGLIATAPVLLLTAVAIKLEDGGPVLFRQERVGLEGRRFSLYKFRSMRVNAESDGTPTWASERDPRITGVGQIIRKLRIDELPQFWNVLRGDMNLIGPRPERPYFVGQFSQTIPFYDCRHAVRPGITGWAQVSFRYGASLEDARRKLSYDLYYIKNRGFFLDLVILLKTFGVVLRGEGAR